MKWLLPFAILLSGCQDKRISQGDDNICLKAPKNDLLAVPHDLASQMEARDGCIHRWAYRLAGAPDSAEVVAKAVLAGCHDTITGTASYMVKEGTATEASLLEEMDNARRQALSMWCKAAPVSAAPTCRKNYCRGYSLAY